MLAELTAGALGTAAVAALSPVERRILGRPPVYAPEQLAASMALGWAGRVPSVTTARKLGIAMRVTYGPAWAFVLAALPRRFQRSPLLGGLAIGGAISAFELIAMPRVGATPPASSWTVAEHALLLAQTAVYGLVTAGALALLRPARR